MKLEHIYYNTPEQNGHIESFHKTLKKEYIWPNDFQNYQEAESAIRDAFLDYNQNRIHSALRYLTPYEFISIPLSIYFLIKSLLEYFKVV